MASGFRRLGTTVIALGVVSFLADVSTEMIVPVLPLFLFITLGASYALIGLIDGAAEASANFVRLYSGYWADRATRRKPLIIAGYAPTALLKPLLAFAMVWWQVLLLRVPDRMAKGGRGPARDSLLDDSTPKHMRGAAFGLHRAMDTAGAIGGAILALPLISHLPGTQDQIYRQMFLIATIPAVASVFVLLFFVKEKERDPPPGPRPSFKGSLRRLSSRLRAFYVASALFTLGTVTPVLAMLRAVDLGSGIVAAVALFVLYHGMEAAVSYPAGSLSDRVGRAPLLAAGFVLAAVGAALFALAPTWSLPLGFALIGAAAGLTDGLQKAFVVDLSPPETKGTALGVHYALTGGAALGAGLMIGLLWQFAGGPAAFGAAATACLVGLAVLGLAGKKPPGSNAKLGPA
jgi:MFS family permease